MRSSAQLTDGAHSSVSLLSAPAHTQNDLQGSLRQEPGASPLSQLLRVGI
jgi:hypothetical protein